MPPNRLRPDGTTPSATRPSRPPCRPLRRPHPHRPAAGLGAVGPPGLRSGGWGARVPPGPSALPSGERPRDATARLSVPDRDRAAEAIAVALAAGSAAVEVAGVEFYVIRGRAT